MLIRERESASLAGLSSCLHGLSVRQSDRSSAVRLVLELLGLLAIPFIEWEPFEHVALQRLLVLESHLRHGSITLSVRHVEAARNGSICTGSRCAAEGCSEYVF